MLRCIYAKSLLLIFCIICMGNTGYMPSTIRGEGGVDSNGGIDMNLCSERDELCATAVVSNGGG